MNARLALIAVAVLAAALAAAPGAAPTTAHVLQATPVPPPWTMTWDRKVSPLDVEVGDEVEVEITVGGDYTPLSKGMDVFFVIDRSLTMFDTALTRPHLMDRTKDALKDFVNAMDFSKSKAGVISYAVEENINRKLDDDQEAIIRAIDGIRLSQETDVRGLQGAFRTATQLIDNDGSPENEKYVFVVTAGPDITQANINMPTVTQAARNAGVNVIFLMWATRNTDSAYTHYVDAASDCTWDKCTNWGGAGRKYAWRIAPAGERGGIAIDTLISDLVGHFLFRLSLSQLEVEEAYDPRQVDFISITPPFSAPGPPYTNVLWRYTEFAPGGITIRYAAAMKREGTYPVALETFLRLTDSAGKQWGPYPLPNPDVTVRTRATVTPPPVTDTPTVVAPTTPAATDTPTAGATTPAVTETPTRAATTPAPPPGLVCVPLALDNFTH